ncbi:(2Fe-2S)-binding protein [Alteribacillus bidgolensis]|uniref:BFD-like [2Fe-2S] binding domain-containing protein n=1 Tax=Alteribacillus bidgolensis TaxID=930129 RepID=A0A1G8HIJ4_9BACI|nr:(2Fe-2S)-binding protein [Alteribacillus bidgolensis]SDI06382.1 BFD-like [2Fe-2S] binding domain-containing protein [Alteribacillus bidgolensis]
MRKNDTIICRCEEVTYKDLLKTANTYQCTARELKLRTRAGMGICGGRTCRFLIEGIAQANKSNEVSFSKEVPLKYQPPIRPIRFDSGKENG